MFLEASELALGAAGGNVSVAVQLFFVLMLVHALGDFPLQGQFLALGKERGYWTRPERGRPEMPPSTWFVCLTYHCLIQAGGVWLVTGIWVYALIEFVVHWVTDLAKGEGWIGFMVDQTIHLLTKVVLVVMIANGVFL